MDSCPLQYEDCATVKKSMLIRNARIYYAGVLLGYDIFLTRNESYHEMFPIPILLY